MWNIIKVKETGLEEIGVVLRQGYEPFAVSTDSYGYCTIWFKRELGRGEILNKPTEHKQGRSRKTLTAAKG